LKRLVPISLKLMRDGENKKQAIGRLPYNTVFATILHHKNVNLMGPLEVRPRNDR